MQKGPRGGGRDRDAIIRHVFRVESLDFAKQVGLELPDGPILVGEGLQRYREDYVAGMRAYNGGQFERRMKKWTLPFLIRHSAFHTLDHAWEMEDKDLSGRPIGGSIVKLLLTSAGIKNPSIREALLELLGKPIAEPTPCAFLLRHTGTP